MKYASLLLVAVLAVGALLADTELFESYRAALLET